MLFDHYLCVFHWSLEFVSSNAKIQKTMVWVRFPGLNLLYYNESVLMGIASVIGKPIRVDKNTLNIERGRFARVCVEIDLTKPVVGKYSLDEQWYMVEYEGLHLICSTCGCYGHLTQTCTQNSAGPAANLETPSTNIDQGGRVLHLTHEVREANSVSGQENPKGSTGVMFHAPPEEGVNAELSKGVHGDWMTVTRKKRDVPKKVNNQVLHGIKHSWLTNPTKTSWHLRVLAKRDRRVLEMPH